VLKWDWEAQSPAYANFGNANQWTVNAGLASLARETAQNSNDARIGSEPADLVYTFIRLTGERRRDFESALAWDDQLRPHLEAMRASAKGAVASGQLVAGLDALHRSPALVLLRVADHGCRGLAGPEFADDDPDTFGDFVKLCRLDLFSGKDAAAGGSFGLGKAVYWRFSRLQTVLFNSTVQPGHGSDGHTRNRLFGVQQGVAHRQDGKAYVGRGYFGVTSAVNGAVESTWADEGVVESIHLGREDARPGTSALVVGFYDPDDPDAGLDGRKDLLRLAGDLRAGIEESFWPALARGRMRVRIDIEEDGRRVHSEQVDAAETFTELVHALHSVDTGDLAESLDEPGAVVVRDIPIRIPRRRVPDQPAFDHVAKLVVTLSDDVRDALENKVCLLRGPEMVVETIENPMEGRTFHAFLLAGEAKVPGEADPLDTRADDFLRFAEPGQPDRALRGPLEAEPPGHRDRSALRTARPLRAARAAAGHGAEVGPQAPAVPASRGGPRGPSGPRKPTVTVESGWIEDGQWVVDFWIRAQNRPGGWSMRPKFALVGLDGSLSTVEWAGPLEALSTEGTTAGTTVVLPHKPSARVVKVRVRGVSARDLPIPADESAVDVVLRDIAFAPAGDLA
jgi:hypothetical protein